MSIDLSLDRLKQLVSHLPPYTRPTCHIAGTNGKGSVAATISSIIHESSLSFGRYNSPHLVSVYDCIIINNEPVSPTIYKEARTEVERADKEHDTKLSSFEILTLTALYIFEELNVDIAVIEVGLGGRLDATNIIPDSAIIASALTTVDLDHQFFLGMTPTDITKEKAAISRKDKPFILGPQKYPEVLEVTRKIVQEVGGKLILAERASKRDWDESIDGSGSSLGSFTLSPTSFQPPAPQPVHISLSCFPNNIPALLPLYGEHQLDNLGTAVTLISAIQQHPSTQNKITPESVAKGIKAVRWAGRLSFHTLTVKDVTPQEPLVVLADGAHNPGSSMTLGAYVTHLISLLSSSTGSNKLTFNITYVLSLSHSPPKTPVQTLSPILPPTLPSGTSSKVSLNVNVAAIRFTPPEGMPWVKSVPPSELAVVIRERTPNASLWIAKDDDPADGQLAESLKWVSQQQQKQRKEGENVQELVVLAGSLYLVADFYRYIGMSVGI